MPERPATVAAYAAGASLAAITLFYVFGPTFFIDGDNSTSGGKKKTIVGLINPANDCFINSVLQALSGLGDLRLYLIREIHRRNLDGPELYSALPELKKNEKPDRVRELQQGVITQSLKDMLDALNERPIYRKTISARPFIESLERAFRTRISRTQQDAQEFLQVVAERLCDEYHAGEKARQRALRVSQGLGIEGIPQADSDAPANGIPVEGQQRDNAHETSDNTTVDSGFAFPMEGQIESQIECQHCHFQYKPSKSSFVTLTLNVPLQNTTTLSNCFDGLLKTEYIDDFKCDKCRVQHAIESKRTSLSRKVSEEQRTILEEEIAKLTDILEQDPEKELKGISMPSSDGAPKRKIAKHMRIVLYPRIIAVHLSRSIYDPGQYSTKNAAKVSFPERLRLGGLLEEKWYKLLGIVCHKGSHNSGHYESFRRQHVYPPFATPDAFSAYASYSRNASPIPSNMPSPRLAAVPSGTNLSSTASTLPRGSDSRTPSRSSTSPSTPPTPPTRPSSGLRQTPKLPPSVTSNPRSSVQTEGSATPRRSLQSDRSVAKSVAPSVKPQGSSDALRLRRKKKTPDRWWRVSDDKVKECKTTDVLGMQKEVYLLFYELEKAGENGL